MSISPTIVDISAAWKGYMQAKKQAINDLRDAADVRRRVAMPVARSLLRADELEDVVVEVGPDHFSAVGRVDALRLAVKARGEWIETPLRWSVTDSPWDAEWLADELYDLLQDELAESRLAWGELREGTFEVLLPQRPQL